MKNYIDTGLLVNQKMAQNSDKMHQTVEYMDKSIFRGEVVQDEESKLVYKEGAGLHARATQDNLNLCFYNQIVGNWSRGILHGKRIEYRMNLAVFPIGYYQSYIDSS